MLDVVCLGVCWSGKKLCSFFCTVLKFQGCAPHRSLSYQRACIRSKRRPSCMKSGVDPICTPLPFWVARARSSETSPPYVWRHSTRYEYREIPRGSTARPPVPPQLPLLLSRSIPATQQAGPLSIHLPGESRSRLQSQAELQRQRFSPSFRHQGPVIRLSSAVTSTWTILNPNLNIKPCLTARSYSVHAIIINNRTLPIAVPS